MSEAVRLEPLKVALGDRSYEVHVAPGCLDRIAGIMLNVLEPSRVLVVTGTGRVEAYGRSVLRSLDAAGVPSTLVRLRSGERYKTLSAVARLYEAMIRQGLDRRSAVVAVGGGVVGDIAGFAAGTYMRGIAFVQAPTTLLAQADAGIGGKTGVNLPQGKNLVGVFHQPRVVVMDTTTLQTLNARDFRSGLAEILKHAFIRDGRFLDWLTACAFAISNRDANRLAEAVDWSCRIKADVVSEDETEQGLRAVLNFGHTLGHALEALAGYRHLTHGEAVSIGMVAACRVGEEIGVTSQNVTARVIEALADVGLPAEAPPWMEPEAALERMMADKKTLSRRLRFVLLREVGRAEPGFEVPEDAVIRALQRCRGTLV